MKIDLVGEKDRGLAMGLNEFAGYFAVGLVAFFTSIVANRYGITPYPFYIGIVISVLGFVLTALWVKDTPVFVAKKGVWYLNKPIVFMASSTENSFLAYRQNEFLVITA